MLQQIYQSGEKQILDTDNVIAHNIKIYNMM